MLVGCGAGAFAACGLDESGLVGAEGGVDVTVMDVPVDVPVDVPMDVPLDVPQACSTLDASACVDADLPDGWTYVAFATGDTACPAGDYTKSTYLEKPTPEAGACSCTCTPSGTYSCAGTIAFGYGGGSCTNTKTSFDGGDDAACVVTGGNDPHLAVGPLPTPSGGTAACAPSATGTKAWSATDTTACTPGCTVDYCGLPGPFKRCVLSTTSTTCPAPFVAAAKVGPASAVAVTCAQCTCAGTPSGPCTATITPYGSNDCTGTPYNDVAPDASCVNFGGGNNVPSFAYAPGPQPPPACSLAGSSGTGSADFTQAATICCLP